MLLNRGYDVALFGGLPRIRLIEPGRIARPDLLSFARAQLTGVASTTLGSDDATWSEVAADVPRFYGSARRLRIEGQRTNLCTNPRAGGGIPGTPGTLPSGYAAYVAATGISRQVVEAGTSGGINYWDVRYFGTAFASGEVTLYPPPAYISVATGDAVTASAFLAIVGGSTSNIATATLRVIEATSGGAYLREGGVSYLSFSSALTRFIRTSTIGASTGRALLGISITVVAGSAIDVTIRIGWPQLELGSFASTPVLPPALSPAASTRGASLVTAARESLFPSRRGVLLLSGAWGQNAPSGADQMALQIDDTSANNRLRVRNAAGGATVVAGRVTGGSSADLTSLGSMTAGTQTSLGLAFDLDTGAFKAMLRGGSVQSGSGGPTSASVVRLGTDSAGASAMFGDAGYWDAINGVYPSDAQFAQWVNSMPLAA